MFVTLSIVLMLAQPPGPSTTRGPITHPRAFGQEVECTRCDLVEGRQALEAELAFLKRAEAAFLFSHRSTTEVKARIRTIEQRLARLEEEGEEPARPPGSLASRIQEMQAELRFLERAEAAFFHSHRSTAEVKRRIQAARECLETLRDCLDTLRDGPSAADSTPHERTRSERRDAYSPVLDGEPLRWYLPM